MRFKFEAPAVFTSLRQPSVVRSTKPQTRLGPIPDSLRQCGKYQDRSYQDRYGGRDAKPLSFDRRSASNARADFQLASSQEAAPDREKRESDPEEDGSYDVLHLTVVFLLRLCGGDDTCCADASAKSADDVRGALYNRGELASIKAESGKRYSVSADYRPQ